MRKEDILANCIDEILAGKSTIEDCLARYPHLSDELRPLLKLALGIQPEEVTPSPEFKQRARKRLLEAMQPSVAPTEPRRLDIFGWLKPLARRTAVAIVVAALLVGGGATAYAAQESMPGDALYPLKLGTEQARLVLSRSDTSKAELYLTFANRRVEEMATLAERGRPEKVNIAANGYDGAIGMAIGKMEEARGKGLAIADISELVAEATLKHLEVLEGLLETVPDEAVPGIEKAIEVSMTGQENAVLALAGKNPLRAMEINLSTMEGRLNMAKAKAEGNDIEGVEAALAEVEELRHFGEEISEIARGLGRDTTALDELVARATASHLEILAMVYEKAPEQAKEAIERAMEESVKGYGTAVEALEEAGALDDILEEPPIPEGIPDEVKRKLEELIPPKPKVPAKGRP